jgi:hypothetical protein
MSHLTDLFPNIPDVDKHQKAAEAITVPQSCIDEAIAYSKKLADVDDVICPKRSVDGRRSSDIETMIVTSSPVLQRIIYGGMSPNGPATPVDSSGNPLNAGKSDSELASTAVPTQQILADVDSAAAAANDSVTQFATDKAAADKAAAEAKAIAAAKLAQSVPPVQPVNS